MAGNYPHLKDSAFPDLPSVDVYKYANEFDYSRFDAAQMRLQMCTVPWDMGEAHIGNRTISGIGNVVFFESKAERNAWFDAIPDTECYRFETKFKELHRSNQIDVPVPFDVASKYNYLVVEYNLFANDDSLVEYENDEGLKRWYWFIREVEFVAPNSTKLHLMSDAWQTFIYDLNVAGMILERGHAPMTEVSASTYLSKPASYAGHLLHEDITNENSMPVAYNAGELVFNSKNMYAVIITTSNPVNGAWGSKANDNWKVAGKHHWQQDGVPSYLAFAIVATNLSAFLTNLDENCPQFLQTVEGICFISSDFITLGTTPFTFGGQSCYYVSSSYKKSTVLTLDKAQFGYPVNYADIAKLYTYPYAYIELTDETGDVTQIRIENTNGKIEFESYLNLVLPWLNVSGHLVSTGRGEIRNITFANVTSKNMPIKGNWYETLRSWDIPVFGITQGSREHNDYATHYDRLHQAVAYGNAYDSAIASSAAAKTNSYSEAATNKTNADANADTGTAIAGLQVTANNANVSANKTKINNDAAADKALNVYNDWYSDDYIDATTNNQINAADQIAAISAASSAASAGVNAITSALSGDIAGAVGSVVNGGISAASTLAMNQITVNQTATQAASQKSYNNANKVGSNAMIDAHATNMKDNQDSVRDNNNALTTGAASASAATIKANATRSKDTTEDIADLNKTTADANAVRNKDTAIDAVDQQIAQAAMNVPLKFGSFIAGENATTKPMGLFANIVTQDEFSIAYAGDAMLRYGYMYERQWDFDGDWNVCKYFTYWKLADFWVSNLDIPDMYVDKIRFFLFGGVTVWRKPEYIGHKGIYDNIDWS